MGPTNVALVKYFQADQLVRQAKERLDAATKDVRVQERRVNDLLEKHKLATANQKSGQVKAMQLDLELKTFDARIEKLRLQQTNAKTDKEYKTFLIEINTFKTDREKVEDDAMKVLEGVAKITEEIKTLDGSITQEREKLEQMKVQINDKTAEMKAEIEALTPAREEAAQAVPKQARDYFDRLADRFDGEGMSAITKPDRRREEYMCGACNMDLVVDVYNKLHGLRDEMVFCPSCRRILYIPEDLTPDVAVKTKVAGSPTAKKLLGPRAAKPHLTMDARTMEIVRVLTKAAGESARNAIAAGNKPGEFEVLVEGKLVGVFKGQNVDNLKRTARFCLHESGVIGEVEVREKQAPPPQPVAQAQASEPESADQPAQERTNSTPAAETVPPQA